MRQARPEDGPVSLFTWLLVLEIRLSSRPDTRALADQVRAARLDLKRRLDEHIEVEARRIAATGEIAFSDDVEDGVIADLARMARALFGGGLGNADYERLFEEAASTTTRGVATDEQASLASHLIHLLETDGRYLGLADKLPALREARVDVRAAQDRRRTCEAAERTSWSELQVAEGAARDVHNGMEPRLAILFPGQRRRVDSFFYRSRRTEPAASGPAAPGTDG